MSTLTHAQTQPTPTEGPRGRLLSLPLALAFLAEFTTLTSFFLMLAELPMLAAAAGVSSSGAGLITGSLLLGTVTAEAAAAPGIRRFGYRPVLAAGAVLLGAPAFILIPREPQAVMMIVSFVRGLGFGLCGVTTGALAATLLPPERRGEGLGLLGIVCGVPAVVALPTGVWLTGHHLAVAATATAALFGLLPLATVRWLPGRDRSGRDGSHGGTDGAAPGARTRPVPGRTLRLPLIFAAVTVAAGAADSFLPLAKGVSSNLSSAALLVQAIVATLCRWQAGRHGDRHGHAGQLVPALAVAALGMTAMIWMASPALVFVSMATFGAGFGVLENATFALLIERLPEARASALWNFAYDAGYGAGPAVFGLLASRTGYPAGFALTGVLVLAVLPAALRERAVSTRSVSTRPVSTRPVSARSVSTRPA
jgi:MFS family permease